MGTAFGAWIGAYLLAAVGAAIVFTIGGVEVDDDPSLGLQLVAQLPQWGLFLGVPMFLAVRHGVVDRLIDWRTELGDLRYVVGGVAAQLAVNILSLPILWIFDVDESKFDDAARELTDRANGGWGVALFVIIAVLGAPFFEEIFYRGFFQQTMIGRLGERWGIAIASAVFAVSHFAGTVETAIILPGLFVAAVLMGLARSRTGRLVPAIALHLGFNLTAAVTLLA